jgi:aspartate ammonia-lyase
MSRFRIDKDSLGEIKVPSDAYYGPFTVRANNQYNITGQRSHPDLVRAYVMIKGVRIVQFNRLSGKKFPAQL